MLLPFRFVAFAFVLISGLATSYSVLAEDVYDRLDGTGPSQKKVDVIEWEGNLEVHVFPKASTAGLGAKLDDRTEGKKVMVIGYHFKGQKEILVRRAILGVPFTNKIKGFIDPTEKDFDKLAFSNSDLPAPWKPYKLDSPPKTWYPDGDERNAEDPQTTPKLTDRGSSIPTPGTAKAENPAKARRPSSEDEGSLNQYNW